MILVKNLGPSGSGWHEQVVRPFPTITGRQMVNSLDEKGGVSHPRVEERNNLRDK